MNSGLHRVFAIVNPVSANGSTAQFWPKAYAGLRAAGISVDAQLTDARNHATAIAREAAEKGYPFILYVGGDGTANEVANGLLQLPEDGRPALAALPRGTGGDFPKALNLKPGLEAAIQRLRDVRRTRIDVGRSSFTGFDNRPADRAFINVADAGLGGRVTERVNQSRKPLGGTIAFLWAILATFWSHKNQTMSVTVDGRLVHQGPVAAAIVANGCYFGGGVKIAPAARPDDGVLDILVVGDINKLDLLSQVPHMYRGTHVNHPKVSVFRGREVQVHSSEQMPLDFDGENPGHGPFSVRLDPSALDVLT